MDELFNKAKEMAQDPAMQERLKNEAQKRFGSETSKSPDHAGGESGEESPDSGSAPDIADESETRD